ncbi:hypothetical protein BJX63DRAFT_63436 [Aspergillus granulosus]|uniref:Rhamnogalacturonase A/B/Epimerase-like pectate lyase domain-containing protein n=1 Tax=Aspergillus granulosus TaxID=176169 RepID=A0ABR4GWW6_9EURO
MMAPSSPLIRLLALLLCLHGCAAALEEGILRFVPGLLSSVRNARYAPHPSGIPFTIQNYAAQPWQGLNNITHQENRPAVTCASSSTSSKFWYEEITHNGESSFLVPGYKENYKVFRNVVTDYGADNTGQTDASSAIQTAIRGKGDFCSAC